MCQLLSEVVLRPDLGTGQFHMDASSAIGVGVVLALLIGLSVFIAHLHLSQRKQQKQALATPPVPVKQEMQATVVDLCCAVRTVGYQTPKTVTLFAVTFESADGQHLQLQVPEEMYEGFEKEQRGLLTLVDGELYSFELADI